MSSVYIPSAVTPISDIARRTIASQQALRRYGVGDRVWWDMCDGKGRREGKVVRLIQEPEAIVPCVDVRPKGSRKTVRLTQCRAKKCG